MIVLMVSKWVGDLFNISLYDLHVELKCMPFVEAAPSGNMYHLKAKDVMAHPVVCLQEQETVGSVLASLRACSHNGYPIVRPSEDGSGPKFTGMIVRNQLVVLLNQGAWGPTETAMSRVHFDDFSTSLSSKVSRYQLIAPPSLSHSHLLVGGILLRSGRRVVSCPPPLRSSPPDPQYHSYLGTHYFDAAHYARG